MRKVLDFIRKVSGFREKAKTPCWGIVDQGRARAQGWELCEKLVLDRGHIGGAGWMLQKHDDARIFARDEHAWLFVYNQMLCGDPTAVRAFDFLQVNAVNEYDAIMKFCRLANAA